MFGKQTVTDMAKLVTTKEKYGVSVAGRIDPQLALQISERAERLGLSMARMISMLISNGFNQSPPRPTDDSASVISLNAEIEQLNGQLNDTISLYKETAAEFIIRAGKDEQHVTRLAELYNEVLEEKKN